jgi:hypothetical protein
MFGSTNRRSRFLVTARGAPSGAPRSFLSPPIAAGRRIFSGDLDGVLHAFALAPR